MFGALDFLRLDSAALLATALGILSTEPDLATAVVRASPLGFAAESERRRDRGNEAGALGRMAGSRGSKGGGCLVRLLFACKGEDPYFVCRWRNGYCWYCQIQYPFGLDAVVFYLFNSPVRNTWL